jgi:hypothetical protein
MAVAGVVAGQYGTKIQDITYAKTWLVKWYLQTDFREITSTTYQADLKQGHQLKIRIKPDVTINTYTANADITFENPTTTTVLMAIDQALYFAVAEDKVETQQADMDNLSAWVEDGMKQMEITVEKDCYALFPTEAAAQNAGATAGVDGAYDLGTKALPVVITKANVVEYISRHALVLDDSDVPREMRNLVVPHWMATLIARSDEFDKANQTGDDETSLRDRYVGRVMGFKVYESNNLDKEVDGGTGDDTVWNIFSAHKSALQFAGQLDISGTVEREARFDKGNKALFVYGRKCTKADGIVHGIITNVAIV